MKITGTREAFLHMISERGVYNKLGVKPSAVSLWKKRLKQGHYVTLDKMEEMLLKYGATVEADKIWEINK